MLFAGLFGAAAWLLVAYLFGHPAIGWIGAITAYLLIEGLVIYLAVTRKEVTRQQLLRWGVVIVVSGMVVSVFVFALRAVLTS